MPDQFAVVSVNADTSGGTQDITDSAITDFQGAIIFVSGAVAIATTADHARKSIGICDDLGNARVLASRSEDAVGTTNSRNEGNTAEVVLIQSTSSTANVAVATAVDRATSGLANGIRINWTTTPDLAYEMIVVLIGGTTNLTIGGGAVPTTAASVNVGYRPNVVFFPTTFASLTGAALDYNIGFGAAVDAVGEPQASIYGRWDNAVGTSDADAIVDTDSAGGEAAGVTPTFNSFDVTTFETNGWQWEATTTNVFTNYIAIEFSDDRVAAIAVETLPGATGNASFTGLGIQPDFILGIANLMTVEDTATDGPTAASEALFAFSNTAEFSQSTHEEEGVGTSNTGSRTDSSALSILDDTGSVAVNASLVSFDANGPTLNFSTATAGRAIFIAFQELGMPIVLNETVEIGEQLTVIRQIPAIIIDETVEIAEGEVTLATDVDIESTLTSPRRGMTLEGGAARAISLEGGGVAGNTKEMN